METFTWSPQTATKKSDPRIRRSVFGDGYEQRVQNGINAVAGEWSLTFVRPIAEIDTIEAFLVARGGHESFAWTDPRGNSITVVCDGWSVSPASGLRASSLSATFRQVFE